jgi:integrase
VTADEAFAAFGKWLDGAADANGNGICKLRELSRGSLRNRVEQFVNSLGWVRVSEVSPEIVENFLGKLNVSARTRENYKLNISRFFSWCIERPRRWTASNPCALISIDHDEKGAPEILTVAECERLLRAAEAHGMAPYFAVALFGGLRPFEIRRLAWDNVNFDDREIRVDGKTSKTGRSRVVTMDETLHAWLSACKGEPFMPKGFFQLFPKITKAAGLTRWPVDVLRHTSISHYFRSTGSYGLCAERFGNSEKMIKAHYQSRVSTADTRLFFALKPTP